MDAMELLRTRCSALKLGEPAPSPEAVRAMLESAARVPDVGFIYVGTDIGGPGTRSRRTARELAEHWTGRRAEPPGS
jgi:hypothetical protein